MVFKVSATFFPVRALAVNAGLFNLEFRSLSITLGDKIGVPFLARSILLY
jgi:hypothetical protein